MEVMREGVCNGADTSEFKSQPHPQLCDLGYIVPLLQVPVSLSAKLRDSLTITTDV